jgi:hypothetical protein
MSYTEHSRARGVRGNAFCLREISFSGQLRGIFLRPLFSNA